MDAGDGRIWYGFNPQMGQKRKKCVEKLPRTALKGQRDSGHPDSNKKRVKQAAPLREVKVGPKPCDLIMGPTLPPFRNKKTSCIVNGHTL